MTGGYLLVEGRVGADKVRDVGDVDADLKQAVLVEQTAVQRVVDVGAAGRVDAAHVQVAQVGAARHLFLADAPRKRRQTGQHRLRFVLQLPVSSLKLAGKTRTLC